MRGTPQSTTKFDLCNSAAISAIAELVIVAVAGVSIIQPTLLSHDSVHGFLSNMTSEISIKTAESSTLLQPVKVDIRLKLTLY